jgi:cleavage and polyadenylation specificity factor subunit 2
MTKDIFAPFQGEEVKIGQQMNSFSITLGDEFLSTVKMSSVRLSPMFISPVIDVQQFEDNQVGFVTGRISMHADATPALEPLMSGFIPKATHNAAARGRKRILGSRVPASLPHSTLIGDLKLTALKARLATVGIHAELVGEGVLMCGKKGASTNSLEESVAVKKTGRGKVEMEGSVSDVYYAVRREVYNLHALVSQS